MSHLTAEIHISASPTDRPLPSTPIPLSPTSSTLSPSTQLLIPLTPSSSKPQHLSTLADSIDTARSNLNKILTTWKDWSGKEHLPPQNHDDDDDDDDDEDQDEE